MEARTTQMLCGTVTKKEELPRTLAQRLFSWVNPVMVKLEVTDKNG